jgi:hypothetical protein
MTLSLSACTTDVSDGHESAVPSGGLQGPWAQEFTEALADKPSSFERGVLADGVVTENELAEAHHGMQRCMKDARLIIDWFTDGGFEVGGLDGGSPPYSSGRTDDILRACERRWDNSITYLFEQTRRNPDKQDEAKITVACLRTAGVVPKSYSERKWREEDDKGVYSFNEHSAEAEQCRLDPLGRWRKQ